MMQVAIQVAASVGLVVAVLWWMWRLPRENEALFGWGPPLGLLSAWCGAVSILGTACLWIAPQPDKWIAMLFLILEPAAVAGGILVLWIYRGYEDDGQTISLQRQQATVGITLGLIAVAAGYLFVMTHKTPFTPVGV
jgi:hypothetical protein